MKSKYLIFLAMAAALICGCAERSQSAAAPQFASKIAAEISAKKSRNGEAEISQQKRQLICEQNNFESKKFAQNGKKFARKLKIIFKSKELNFSGIAVVKKTAKNTSAQLFSGGSAVMKISSNSSKICLQNAQERRCVGQRMFNKRFLGLSSDAQILAQMLMQQRLDGFILSKNSAANGQKLYLQNDASVLIESKIINNFAAKNGSRTIAKNGGAQGSVQGGAQGGAQNFEAINCAKSLRFSSPAAKILIKNLNF